MTISACHYAWLYGDAKVRALAKQLMQRWVNVLESSQGTYGHYDGTDGHRDMSILTSPTTLLGLQDVTSEMGIPHWGAGWTGTILDHAANELNMLVQPMKDHLVDWLSKPRIRALGKKGSMPSKLRHRIADLVFSQVDTLGDLLRLPNTVDAAMHRLHVNKKFFGPVADAIKSGLSGILGVSFNSDLAERALIFQGAYAVTLANLRLGIEFPGGVHLSFWDFELNDQKHPSLRAPAEFWKQTMAAAAQPHRNASTSGSPTTWTGPARTCQTGIRSSLEKTTCGSTPRQIRTRSSRTRAGMAAPRGLTIWSSAVSSA